ncbi:MAG: ABC transporter ATP-binding protein [Candidatus Methanomethylophilus sp.]|nr:ABC transporter ATP-binding protein [Methanomethylophilus sp.]
MSLDIANLFQGYGKREVLKNVTLSVKKGETVTVLGPNGSGKSTLIRTICGILPPRAGMITVDGMSISGFDRQKFARTIGYVPQGQTSCDGMKVFDAVLIGRAPYISWSYSQADFDAAEKAIDMLELDSLLDRNVSDLSGGQAQKVAIARALVQDPRYYIIDEPTNNLDLRNQLMTLRIMREIASKKHAGTLVALHDLNLAIRYSDRVLMLKDGCTYGFGTPSEVITPENIAAVYGVSAEVVSGRGGRYVHVLNDGSEDISPVV